MMGEMGFGFWLGNISCGQVLFVVVVVVGRSNKNTFSTQFLLLSLFLCPNLSDDCVFCHV